MPGVPGPPPGLPAAFRKEDPPPPKPEVRLTFNEEEEKKRAERARRFAPRPASFELEERERAEGGEAAGGEAAGGEAAGVEAAGVEATPSPPAQAELEAKLAPEMPFGLGFGDEGVPAGLEDQIADYLL